jgi:hypothetical protein
MPKPGERVNIRLTSSSVNLDASVVSWYVNNNPISSGIGNKTVSVVMGSAGDKLDIVALIEPPDEQTIIRNLVLYPTEVSLLWQAHTYTPPFYKGKAHNTKGGSVTVVAVPDFVTNNRKIPDSELIYRWQLNNKLVPASSGYGKNSFTYTNKFTNHKDEVDVLVMTTDEVIQSKATVVIPADSPEIILYEEHPLYGLWFDSALPNNIVLSGQEISLMIAPFFFAVRTEQDTSLDYRWRINGQENLVGEARGHITFRNESSDAGITRINLQIQDTTQVISYAQKTFDLTFGTQ